MNNLMFRSVLVSLAMLSVPALAGRTIYVTGSATATESDRSSADSEALDQATTQANALCIGNVISTSKTMDTCFKIGDGDNAQYTCSVMVRAACELPGR